MRLPCLWVARDLADPLRQVPGREIGERDRLEHGAEIRAHREGLVSGLTVAAGEAVKSGQVICLVVQEGESEDGPASQ